jgi:hypothetical protein
MAWPLLIRFYDNEKYGAGTALVEEVSRMRGRNEIKTTLGDLIAAVTDEVSPLTDSSIKTDILVSYILNDLLATRRVRFKNRSALNIL